MICERALREELEDEREGVLRCGCSVDCKRVEADETRMPKSREDGQLGAKCLLQRCTILWRRPHGELEALDRDGLATDLTSVNCSSRSLAQFCRKCVRRISQHCETHALNVDFIRLIHERGVL